MKKVAVILAACFLTSGCGGVAVLSAARSIPPRRWRRRPVGRTSGRDGLSVGHREGPQSSDGEGTALIRLSLPRLAPLPREGGRQGEP